jgi:hypothetical protein
MDTHHDERTSRSRWQYRIWPLINAAILVGFSFSLARILEWTLYDGVILSLMLVGIYLGIAIASRSRQSQVMAKISGGALGAVIGVVTSFLPVIVYTILSPDKRPGLMGVDMVLLVSGVATLQAAILGALVGLTCGVFSMIANRFRGTKNSARTEATTRGFDGKSTARCRTSAVSHKRRRPIP